MSQHEFSTFEGNLYSDKEYAIPFRKNFKYTHGHINSTADFKATLRNGQYAWPGGYPMYLITSDGGALCFDCAKEEARQIMDSIRNRYHDGWRVTHCDINYEDNDLYCCHCDKKIESAYGEDEEPGEEE